MVEPSPESTAEDEAGEGLKGKRGEAEPGRRSLVREERQAQERASGHRNKVAVGEGRDKPSRVTDKRKGTRVRAVQ